MGVPVGRTMTLTYGFGAMLGSLGGGLWVIKVRGVSTDEFDVLRSIILYAVVVFGGSSSLVGAFIGALLFVGAGWIIAKFGWKESPNMIYAVVLLAVTAFAYLSKEYPDLSLLAKSPAVAALGVAERVFPALRPSEIVDSLPRVAPVPLSAVFGTIVARMSEIRPKSPFD